MSTAARSTKQSLGGRRDGTELQQALPAAGPPQHLVLPPIVPSRGVAPLTLSGLLCMAHSAIADNLSSARQAYLVRRQARHICTILLVFNQLAVLPAWPGEVPSQALEK